jgi:hypothetical protein
VLFVRKITRSILSAGIVETRNLYIFVENRFAYIGVDGRANYGVQWINLAQDNL